MEFIEKITELKERAENLKENLKTEESTKNALVMPFLSALGYDSINDLFNLKDRIIDRVKEIEANYAKK